MQLTADWFIRAVSTVVNTITNTCWWDTVTGVVALVLPEIWLNKALYTTIIKQHVHNLYFTKAAYKKHKSITGKHTTMDKNKLLRTPKHKKHKNYTTYINKLQKPSRQQKKNA